MAASWQRQNITLRSQPLENFSPGVRRIDMLDIAFASDELGWAVGSQGNILRTTNGGETWEALPSPTTGALQSIAAVSSSQLWIAGDDGIFASQDGGRTWSRQSSALSATKIVMLNAQTGWCVGSSGRIVATQDGGRTWSQQSSTTINLLRSAGFASELIGWTVGVDGVYATTDGGRTWSNQIVRTTSTQFSSIGWHDIAVINTTTAFIAGDDSTIAQTTDGGRTWSRLDVRPQLARNVSVTQLKFLSSAIGYALADRRLMRTINGGRTWDIVFTFPQTTFLGGMTFLNNSRGWVITNQAFTITETTFWRTTDGGASWQQRLASSLNAMTSIRALSPSTLQAVGPVTVRRTTNSGTFWSVQDASAPDNFATSHNATFFLNEQLGWIVGNFGRVFLTTDGGTSWQYQGRTNVFDNILSVRFLTPSQGIVVGRVEPSRGATTGIILRTTDSGKTWIRASFADIASINAVTFINNTKGWAVGSGGAILLTLDGGQTWMRQPSGTARDLLDVSFVDDNHGWIVGGGGESAVIIRTTNGGATWTRQSPPTDNQLRGVFFVNTQTGWAVGRSGTILGTLNGGDTWRQQQSGTTADLNSLAFVNSVRGWVVGDSGVVLRTLNAGYTPTLTVTNAPSLLNFGSLPVGQFAERTLSFQAQYLVEPLVLQVPEGFELDFGSVRSVRTLTIPPDSLAAAAGTITVRFAPKRDGLATGALTVTSALLAGQGRSIGLTGFGLNRPTITATPSSLQFPRTRINEETSATLLLRNVGSSTGTLRVDFPAQGRDFTILTSQTLQNARLRPGDSLQVTVRFSPREQGASSALLRIRTVEFNDSVFVPMSGIGGQARVVFQPQILNLESVSIIGSTTGSIGLTNRGNFPALIVRDPYLASAGASGFSIINRLESRVLDSSETAVLRIGFRPRQTGFVRDTLIVETDAGTAAALIVANAEPLLTAPVIEFPQHQRINIPIAPQFQWTRVASASSYEVQIARDTSFTRLALPTRLLDNVRGFIPDTNLEHGTVYYWRVRALNARTESQWSPVAAFKTIRANPLLRVIADTAFTTAFNLADTSSFERFSFVIASSTRATLTLGSPRFEREFGTGTALWANDSTAFRIKADQFPLSLRSNGTSTVLFDFMPREERRYQATIRIPASGTDSRNPSQIVRDTLELQLVGYGIQADRTLLTTEIGVRVQPLRGTMTGGRTFQPGDSLRLQIVLLNASPTTTLAALRSRNITAFDATLRIRNLSMLTIIGTRPLSPEGMTEDNLSFSGNTITLSNVRRENNPILAELAAIALQGNASTTAIEFVAFDWKNDAANQVQSTIRKVIDSTFTVEVCKADGPRYITRVPAGSIQPPIPNPSHDEVLLNFSINESGLAELVLMDILGRHVKTIAAGRFEPGLYEAHTSIHDLPEGIYTILLKLPSSVARQTLRVTK
jgi:photosystem II stability/assembly factor-like uncharacterized protein